MPITLREITRDNWRDCVRLKVGDDQTDFVASNSYSLAQSRFEPHCHTFGIYAENAMVGFVMYGREPQDSRHWIYRLMIDERHQGHGYGKAALLETVRRMREAYGCTEIRLSCNPRNDFAAGLYERIGFKRTGEMLGTEIIMALDLRAHCP